MRRLSLKLDTAAGLGAIVLWSGTFAFARSLSEQVGPLTGGAAVYLIGGLFFLVRMALMPARLRQLAHLPPLYLFGCGGLFIGYTAAIYMAVGLAQSREQLLEIALVNYLWPALTVLGSLPLLKLRATWWLVPGTALALSGVFLVVTPRGGVSWSTLAQHAQRNPGAYGLALAAAVAWALYSNLARRWSAAGSGGAVELFIPASGLVLLGLRLALRESTTWTARAGMEALALAAITAMAYLLWDLSMRRGNLLFVAACSYFTPLLSTVVTCLYLGVVPGLTLWLGCGLLVAGSLVTWRSVSNLSSGKQPTGGSDTSPA